MRQSHWTGSGPEFNLNWGGREWTLKVDEACPGLRWQSDRSSVVKLLSLDGLAQAGRFDSGAFTWSDAGRFRAPASVCPGDVCSAGMGRPGRTASWSPDALREAIDLEIQVSATSVGELERS